MAYDNRNKGVSVEENDLTALVLALKYNINRDLNVATLAKVVDVNKNVCEPFPLIENEEKKNIYCLKIKNLELNVGDIVIILFCDRNFIQSYNQIINNQLPTKLKENTNLHSDKYGVIIGKL